MIMLSIIRHLRRSQTKLPVELHSVTCNATYKRSLCNNIASIYGLEKKQIAMCYTLHSNCLIQNYVLCNLKSNAKSCMLSLSRPHSSSNASKHEETKKPEQKYAIAKKRDNPYAHFSAGQKAKEVTKDISYVLIIIFGFSIMGYIFYTISSELFSSKSPSAVYKAALNVCKEHYRVSSVLGEPIKGYGETNSRGRRRHIRHIQYVENDRNRMRMQFYMEGSYRKSTVQLEVEEDEQGKFEYRYLLVNVEGYPQETIIIEDNRR